MNTSANCKAVCLLQSPTIYRVILTYSNICREHKGDYQGWPHYPVHHKLFLIRFPAWFFKENLMNIHIWWFWLGQIDGNSTDIMKRKSTYILADATIGKPTVLNRRKNKVPLLTFLVSSLKLQARWQIFRKCIFSAMLHGLELHWLCFPG